MANVSLPVKIQSYVHRQGSTTIYYPQIYGLNNPAVEDKINSEIIKTVNNLIKQQFEEEGADEFGEMIGTFEVKANERNILSVTFSNYAIIPFAAHGLTIMDSRTFNVHTGDHYSLNQLFKQGSSYTDILSKKVNEQIHVRNIVTLDPKQQAEVTSETGFYVSDQTLVLYFQLYDITPYYVGLPLFPIPIYELEAIIKENGPLDLLEGN